MVHLFWYYEIVFATFMQKKSQSPEWSYVW